MKPVYLDYNATTPIDNRVAEAMLPFINEHFGNPSSSHYYGVNAKKAVQEARKSVAELLHCDVDEIIFTSGGSESNNYAIKGAAYAKRNQGNHIITSVIEHPAVIEVCRYLETKGFKVTYLPVNRTGLVNPYEVEEAVTPQTILISIMHANNEVGTVQPITEISAIARKHQVLMHSDCAQSIGKIPVHVDELDVDLLSFAGHKFYAPKGVGALYIRRGVQLEKQVHGADHEMNRRAGTENVAQIVGLGKAAELAANDLQDTYDHLKTMRDRLENAVLDFFPECTVNGHREQCLPNTTSINFTGLEANTIVEALSDNVAVSAGAACHSEQVELSAVLEAMKVPVDRAMGAIRFSVGRFTTRDDIETAVKAIKEVVSAMQPREASTFLPEDDADIKLTRFTHGLGCACKLRPQLLEEALKQWPVAGDANVLVDGRQADDAAVYQIDETTAIVQTVDFFTPVVDDPYQFGAVAAANALSDIYAMGAKPLFALNIVGFPANRLPISVLQRILQGANDVAEKAGIAVIGGHTVDDTEPKFGMAVSGLVHPGRIMRNKGAQVGDVLILTKGLGTGILSTALKRGLLNDEQTLHLYETMSTLNKDAADVMLRFDVHACTDVTGFGLLGHLLEMMRASGRTARLFFEDIPILDGVGDMVTAGVIPGGTKDNQAYTEPYVHYDTRMAETQKIILNDAQTSGGLLISVAEKQAHNFIETLHQRGIQNAAKIGQIVKQEQDNNLCSITL
ncbi:MAG: selenide, water dikinase SelD [Caldithrix sp.]|nr:selenide, water dikinase SelD [Caldithrix sp.]